jgi:hypothetical protein
MKDKKLGVIIPYRDRREHLKTFIRSFKGFMSNKGIDYHIIVVNQDNSKLFNRGMLLNIGFKYALEYGCDYVVFHDIDMVPIQVDYSFNEYPLHLANNFIRNEESKIQEIFDEYFGGVTLFPIEDFKKIDGFSNKYWGWGYEDTDLLHRCKKHGIKLDYLKIKNLGNDGINLEFNGVDSYVRGRNVFDLSNDCTFFISFYPDKQICDHLRDTDEYNVFTIPGYDFSISYNSFSRYNVCIFDKNKNSFFINSKIKTNYKTNIAVTLDAKNKKLTTYQDGVLIGTVDYPNIYPYEKEEFFYLGVGKPDRNDEVQKNKFKPKFYKGYIDSFVTYNKILNEREIIEISNSKNKKLTKNFGDYNSSENITLYYDAKSISDYKLVDLSGNNNHGEIVKCKIVNLKFDEHKTLKIPFKRVSTFSLLPHKENGFHKNKWKYNATRWNQVRFMNEVKNNIELIFNDGLSTLKFTEYNLKKIEDNITHINVGLE